MEQQQSLMRRRSPSLTVAVKDTGRSTPSDSAFRHRESWNKYGHDIRATIPLPRIPIVLSQPSREEFLRIRNWSIEKRRYEERQMDLEQQRSRLRDQVQMQSLEATRQAKHVAIVEAAQRRQQERERLQQERTAAHERYLAFRRDAKPLLYEVRPKEFEQALERLENMRLELYNVKVKPFRTVRPRDILATNVLKQLGRREELNEIDIPFNPHSSTHASLPPITISNKQDPSRDEDHAAIEQRRLFNAPDLSYKEEENVGIVSLVNENDPRAQFQQHAQQQTWEEISTSTKHKEEQNERMLDTTHDGDTENVSTNKHDDTSPQQLDTIVNE